MFSNARSVEYMPLYSRSYAPDLVDMLVNRFSKETMQLAHHCLYDIELGMG